MQDLKKQDMEYFNAVGKYASNKYYINQDNRDNQKAALKNGSRAVAEDLRQKDENRYKLKQEQMRAAAEARKEEWNKHLESEQRKKDDIK